MGETERGNLKKYSLTVNRHYSKVVYNIKLPFARFEFTMHMQN